MLTDRDFPVLMFLADCHVANRPMAQRRCYPTDRDGRITRRRLNALCREGYIRKTRMLVVNPDDGTPGPVYHLAPRGAQMLAERTGDDRYLLKPTTIQQPMHLNHYLAVAEMRLLVEAAVPGTAVTLVGWWNEDEFLNPEVQDPNKRRKLFTELRKQPRLVCAPDAGFLLEVAGFRGVFFGEIDRDRDNYSSKRVAAQKSPGYAELQKRELHRELFPTTNVNRFTMVMISPRRERRDALRRAFRGKDGNQLWRFAARTDLTPQSFFHDDVWYRAEVDEPGPLVKRP